MAGAAPAPNKSPVPEVSDIPETKAAESARLSEEPTAVPQANQDEPEQGNGPTSVAEDGEQGEAMDTSKDVVEADDTPQQGDAAETSEDEDDDEPQVAPLREHYTHEKLCMIRFFRDDLGKDWRSVARKYNEHWYPDHPKGVCKDALYSRYKKEVPKERRGNAGILGVDDEWVWVGEQYKAVPQAGPPKDESATEVENQEATSVAEDGEQGDVMDTSKDDVEADDTQEQGDATDTSEDEDADESQVAALRETYTHEKLCMIRFLRDDLGNDWPSVARMYNEYWYPDHPKGVCKDALYSRYKKEVPEEQRGNAGICLTDDDWVWVREFYWQGRWRESSP
ncbi:hypothetical protein BZA05DRAFT_463458 [Tricharina praecox]|uniref:uncharacterized protein n=1 Tax=Tricharina praecox TaxID=43433 RepID=UPI0022209199|nr:uncharacterized protein BZA05DRAFT_463458 [Tricharina praecox]KAI5856343.1 hypothetical protein BZA05DRAFT_463458 [Tricharina praecox]